MEIKVLGSGCAKCGQQEANVKTAIQDLGIEAKVIKVTDMVDIARYGVMSTPAVVVDEKVVSTGRVLSVKEVEKFLK